MKLQAGVKEVDITERITNETLWQATTTGPEFRYTGKLYQRKVHEGRGVVNTRIAEADAACDIIMKYEKMKLLWFGGDIELTYTWAESLQQ